ncbi:MAG TPA: VanZ family protein, partial [Pirellulales bacterium]
MTLESIAPWFVIALSVIAIIGVVGQRLMADGLRWPVERPPVAGPLRRIHLFWLLLFFAGFALFGSTTPFHFKSLLFGDAVRGMVELWGDPIVLESRSDWTANLLLSVPLGFFGIAMLRVDRPGWPQALWQAAIVLPLCVAYSTFLEFTQFWLPARTPSNDDIAAQSIGAIFGIGLWFLAGQHLVRWGRDILAGKAASKPLHKLVYAYSAIILIQAMIPFAFSISPANLWHKYNRDGMIVLNPDVIGAFSREQLSDTMENILMFATAGWLAAAASLATNRSGRAVGWGALWGFALALVTEFAQLFVDGRYSKVSDVIINTCAASLGAALMWLARRKSSSEMFHPQLSVANESVADRINWKCLAIAAVLSVCLVVIFTAPFKLITDPVRIAKRWHNMWEFPFTDAKFWSDPLVALEDIVRKLVLFGSLGALLIYAMPTGNRSTS